MGPVRILHRAGPRPTVIKRNPHGGHVDVTAAGGTLSTTSSPVISIRARIPRPPIALGLLAAAFAAALWGPIPVLPDADRDATISRLAQRLPGWEVERLATSWEGATTVVTSCAGREIGFQLVPGHGLSPGSAWLLPDDPYSRQQLGDVSDNRRHLVWYPEGARADALPCDDELAGSGRIAD